MEPTLAARCDDVLRSTPLLAVARADFHSFVAAHPAASHVHDLLLACAALQGMRSAHELLERDFFSNLPRIVARLRLPDDQVTELAQPAPATAPTTAVQN